MLFRAILGGFIGSIRALILVRKETDPERIAEICGVRSYKTARVLAVIALLVSLGGVILLVWLIWYFFDWS